MNKVALLDSLITEYRKTHPKSEQFFFESSGSLIGGGSHNLRLFRPFPFYDADCRGSKIMDLDGNTYVDFWQGHFANILGHNPEVVSSVLCDRLGKNSGLTTGFPGTLQRNLAEVIIKRSYAERIRFTTSGTLATMYAIMLSKSFTGQELVMKAGGGWHGAQPFVLKGITEYDNGLHKMESAGLSSEADVLVLTTRFNDIRHLEDQFSEHGERLACLILEPFIGAGGFIFGHKEYLQAARDLTKKHGALLIFDEVVSGFRFHAGALQVLYGIEPDLTVFGKAIGGGMPVSALGGREDVMALCGPDAPRGKRVRFEGGTFSAHPLSMLAGLTFLNHLITNEEDIYPRIGRKGQSIRSEIENIFDSFGFNVRCTGGSDDIKFGSSVIGTHFLCQDVHEVVSPEQVWNPSVCDFQMREQIFKLAMLAEGYNIFHGYGALSASHSDEDIQGSLDAVERVAKKWKDLGLRACLK